MKEEKSGCEWRSCIKAHLVSMRKLKQGSIPLNAALLFLYVIQYHILRNCESSQMKRNNALHLFCWSWSLSPAHQHVNHRKSGHLNRLFAQCRINAVLKRVPNHVANSPVLSFPPNSFCVWQEYPTLTTFFAGEMISRKRPFLTRKWDADEDVDKKHWVSRAFSFLHHWFLSFWTCVSFL